MVSATGTERSGDTSRVARPKLHAPEEQAVTFVELFFDLVFVFAVTQVTVVTAKNLDAAGVARSVLLFWLIWWAWTQFTWTLSPADTEHTIVRVCTLAATGAAFVMAASVPRAFADDPLWFVVPYVVIRAVGMGLQVQIDRERTASDFGVSQGWLTLSTLGLLAVIGGGLVSTPLRNWVWMAALLLDLMASASASRDAVWDLNPRHFAERHGLFVIIALGESLIVAASAIAEEERTADLVMVASASLLVACLLWWTYFGWLKEAMGERFAQAAATETGPIARDAYSLIHFPLICGVIGFAVAVEEMVLHPDRPATGAVTASLAVGVGLLVGASALSYWRVTGVVLVPRLAILALTVAVITALRAADPIWSLAAAAAGLLAVVIVEGTIRSGRKPRPRALTTS